ncbi:hypothetical protein QJS10_CPA05g00882 [Acorus calamus]|uniref:Protein MIZU-KUSSEI 1 n=1 Tax=Acorus calamus TaxID=4465 RepID=A0AAV9EW44_ACOCL|nr:hypothetical protein QJS10_CPA05g00882 [Acorus calamus]
MSVVVGDIIRSFFTSLSHLQKLLTSPQWLPLLWRSSLSPTPLSPPSLKRKVTGTLFGRKRGNVSFAVQEQPMSEPALLLDLPMPTFELVKEMSASPSGTVRIALECPKERSSSTLLLREEPVWTMYCNGRRMGCAVARACGEKDWRLLRTLKAVSVGAGIVPLEERRSIVDGGGEGMGKRGMEVMYMRAKFERVVGSKDSEAFYMINPDGNGSCPELSVFLIRL